MHHHNVAAALRRGLPTRTIHRNAPVVGAVWHAHGDYALGLRDGHANENGTVRAGAHTQPLEHTQCLWATSAREKVANSEQRPDAGHETHEEQQVEYRHARTLASRQRPAGTHRSPPGG